MHRRTLLAAGLTLLAAPATAMPAAPGRTDWRVRASEGFDAIVFLGPLSGQELYRRFYAAEADEFGARLPPAILADIATLYDEARGTAVGLLAPTLANMLSAAPLPTLDAVIAALDDLEGRVRPALRTSRDWDDESWDWLVARQPRIRAIFAAVRDAGFAAFRHERTTGLTNRVEEVARALSGYDVIRWQEKLTGRSFDPTIEVVLLRFAKPHGIKVQGQTFLQSADYDTATTVRVAAHEMLHPPMAMDGPAARAAMAVLARDPLVTRIVRDHDPRWGYTSLEGLLNEDICQALDQLISEALGVGRNPADRWRRSDDGMHVIAAGLYGLLRADGWVARGGSIEAWLADAAARGRLDPARFHPVAARVLERPVEALWPLRAAGE